MDFIFGVVGVLTVDDSGEVRLGRAEEVFVTLCRREDKPAPRQKQGGWFGGGSEKEKR